jgi:hypothetical protein
VARVKQSERLKSNAEPADDGWEARPAPADAGKASLRPLARLLLRLAEAELVAEAKAATKQVEVNG